MLIEPYLIGIKYINQNIRSAGLGATLSFIYKGSGLPETTCPGDNLFWRKILSKLHLHHPYLVLHYYETDTN